MFNINFLINKVLNSPSSVIDHSLDCCEMNHDQIYLSDYWQIALPKILWQYHTSRFRTTSHAVCQSEDETAQQRKATEILLNYTTRPETNTDTTKHIRVRCIFNLLHVCH